MAGTFGPGDLLWVKPLSADSETWPEVGDVILFRVGTGVIAHRVHRVLEGPAFETRGDAAHQPDREPVTRERLIGRVDAVLRDGREVPVARAGRDLRARGLLRWVARFRWLLGAPYYRVASKPRVRRALRWLLRPELRYLRFRAPSGAEIVKIVHGKRVVGWYYPQVDRLRTRPPYALVLERPPSPSVRTSSHSASTRGS